MAMAKNNSNQYILPDYLNPNLLALPSTILNFFGIQPLRKPLSEKYFIGSRDSDKLIIFLFDGLGHNLYQRVAKKYSFFKTLSSKGVYNKLTTVFPSTTSAAITSICSELSPQEHGLPEWYLYFRELDVILKSLPFSPVFSKDESKITHSSSKMLFNKRTIFEKLKENDIPSYILLPQPLDSNFYNLQVNFGGIITPYITYPQLMVNLRNLVNHTKGKALFYIYISAIDSIGHKFGPQSEELRAEISTLSYLLEKEFINKITQSELSRTTLFLTADHGLTSVNPHKTFYLETIQGFDDLLEVSSNEQLILPTGNSRDVFLHIKPRLLEYAIDLLVKNLPQGTRVLKISECVEKGWFGSGNMHEEFMSRIGNLLILPAKNNTVWYHYLPKIHYQHLGAHGGQSEDEMFIPFISTKLSTIIK